MKSLNFLSPESISTCATANPPMYSKAGTKRFVCQKEEYSLQLIRYIHLNPVRAEMGKAPGRYLYSGENPRRARRPKLKMRRALAKVIQELGNQAGIEVNILKRADCTCRSASKNTAWNLSSSIFKSWIPSLASSRHKALASLKRRRFQRDGVCASTMGRIESD